MQTRAASLFEALLEASTDNIYVIDRQGRYTHVSRGAATALGRTMDQVIGRTWRELGISPAVMSEVEKQWLRVFETGETIKHQIRFEGRVYEYSMFPVLDSVAAVSRDVTDHVIAEEELRRATERYRNFVANSSEAIWRFELETPIDVDTPVAEQIEQAFARGYLAECNDAMACMYGFERAEQVIGTPLRDMLDPTQEHNRAYLRAFVENGYRLSEAESIETDRFGNRKYFLNSFTGFVEGGKLLRAWGTQRDVTAERSAFENMHASEQRLQALVQATAQMLFRAAADGNLTWISESWTEATNQTQEQAKGRGWLKCLHPDDRVDALQAWERASQTSTGFTATRRLRLKDGTYRWMQVRAVPVVADDGSLREWVGALVDIDAEHRQAEALAAQRRRAEFIADANDLFARSLDYEQTLRNLVRMAVPRLGDWAAVDMLEADGRLRRLAVEHTDPAMVKLAYELQQRFPEDPNAMQGTYGVAKTGKTQWMSEIPPELIEASAQSPEHLDVIRSLKLHSYVSAPIFERDRVAGVLTLVSSSRSYAEADVALAEDLALRAGHAIENARLYQQAVQANRTKDEFLATLSHELRTPLTAILGWANLLRMSNYDADTIRTALDTIEQSARAQASLIDDLLDISRVVTGKLQLHVAQIDLVAAVENGIAAVRPAAAAKRIRVETELPQSLPMRGDANRIQQIVWNLMSNAVKFSSEDTRIDVSLVRDGDRAVIRVTDQGIGIAPEMLPHVFERFWQADSSAQRSHGGLGLGLAIVKYLAELHGGTVAAESTGVGHGATFIVTLPIGATTRETPDRETRVEAKMARVLLVDDDQAARDVIRRTLEHFGARVTPVATATAAVELVRTGTFDLVLTDLAMPENDGYWLLREIRKVNPRLRVAAVTALGRSSDQIAAAGFDAYLRKPLDPERLSELLARFSS